jgi:hypothetical protein
MAGDKRSRRFVKFRWVFAFMLGGAAGAVSTNLVGFPETIWGVIGLGIPVAAGAAMLEWFGDRRLSWPPRQGNNRWRRPVRKKLGMPTHQTRKEKPLARRGRLHAIAGHKTADPPSSGAS